MARKKRRQATHPGSVDGKAPVARPGSGEGTGRRPYSPAEDSAVSNAVPEPRLHERPFTPAHGDAIRTGMLPEGEL